MDAILVGIPDAAKALGLGRSSIYALIAEGRLEALTIGRRRLVRVSSIHDLAQGALGDRSPSLTDG